MSQLQELLDRRLQPDTRETIQYRVTVRLGSDLHGKLVRLAAVFGMSKTAACEDISAAAVKDAWDYYVGSLDDYERHELFQEMDEEAKQEDFDALQREGPF